MTCNGSNTVLLDNYTINYTNKSLLQGFFNCCKPFISRYCHFCSLGSSAVILLLWYQLKPVSSWNYGRNLPKQSFDCVYIQRYYVNWCFNIKVRNKKVHWQRIWRAAKNSNWVTFLIMSKMTKKLVYCPFSFPNLLLVPQINEHLDTWMVPSGPSYLVQWQHFDSIFHLRHSALNSSQRGLKLPLKISSFAIVHDYNLRGWWEHICCRGK